MIKIETQTHTFYADLQMYNRMLKKPDLICSQTNYRLRNCLHLRAISLDLIQCNQIAVILSSKANFDDLPFSGYQQQFANAVKRKLIML